MKFTPVQILDNLELLNYDYIKATLGSFTKA